MNGPLVSVCLEDCRAHFQPGELLSGEYTIETFDPGEIKATELSVLWYTEGKGEEDLNVHYFQRWNETQLKQLDLNNAVSLRCQLPYSPLSYEGTLVRIRWCVRLRMFCSAGREIVVQMPFQLVSDVIADTP